MMRFIELAKKNSTHTQTLASRPVIQEYIAKKVTVDQFMQIENADAETARILAGVPEIKKLIAKNVTLNQFMDIVKVDTEMASILAEAEEIQNKFYDPSHVLLLMKADADIGVMMIARYKSIRENLIINEFPIKYPDIFGFITMPGELESSSSIDKGEGHLSAAASYGLKPSTEYNSIILFVIGYYFINNFTQFREVFKGLTLTASVHMEIGKMYMDSLNGIDPSPSKELCKVLALAANRRDLCKLNFSQSCSDKRMKFFSSNDIDRLNQRYEQREEYYFQKISDLFKRNPACKLREPANKFARWKNLPAATCLYGALSILDKDRYASKPKNVSDLKSYLKSCLRSILSDNLSDNLVEDAIKEINYQNENYPVNEFIDGLHQDQAGCRMLKV